MAKKVVSFKKTCSACPSQWEGTLKKGQMFYIRYRWGGLSLRISPKSTNNVIEAVSGEEVCYTALGEQYDGVLSTKDMKKKLKNYLNFSDAVRII